ncbi:C-type lectin domain family 2 member D-like [Pelodiscus sinensis]|uniref:C-type lectin domain family 2 member D-like n=1 Tax=Pelodiscus sinensis TaxID=13735 RepID=UPI003F6CF934
MGQTRPNASYSRLVALLHPKPGFSEFRGQRCRLPAQRQRAGADPSLRPGRFGGCCPRPRGFALGRGGAHGGSDNGAHSSSSEPALWKRPGVVWAIIVALGVVIVALAAALRVEKSKHLPPCPAAAPECPNGWIRIRGRCYYFSKAQGDWSYSWNNCSSHAASLAGIEILQELASLLPYPGKLDHWIGLRKDAGGVWRWVNGTEFDHRFEIQGGADCAYLDRDLDVSSSSCSRLRRWLCSKPNTPL